MEHVQKRMGLIPRGALKQHSHLKGITLNSTRARAATVWPAKLLTSLQKNTYMIDARRFRAVCTMVD